MTQDDDSRKHHGGLGNVKTSESEDGFMAQRTVTYDDTQWQLVPRAPTQQMLMDLKGGARDIVKMKEVADDGGARKRIELSCDFALAYRLMLASAPRFAGNMKPREDGEGVAMTKTSKKLP